ncbi:MAG: ABC transporter permease [Planctomycetes bacterium]|nr:ABC transporter permease [Planctomycetota bacterium]MBI3833663.1 ABC transporter permease [Planctomycetota bacterium]
MTFIVVTVVVVVLCVLLSFTAGIRASLAATGTNLNLIVLKPGATAESTSVLVPDEIGRLVQTPGIALGSDGSPLMSRELCVQTTVPRRLSARDKEPAPANVAIRGVDPIAFDLHREVRIIDGRSFQSGTMEIVVGKAAHDRYEHTNIGDEIVLGRMENRIYKVVGVFDAGGATFESELWAPRTSISDSYLRRFDSSVVMRLQSVAATKAAVEFINGPTVQLEAKPEPQYYEDLSKKTQDIVVLSTILVSIMAMGAIFAVANTMFATVDGRRREIAMLRTIGFGKWAILVSFVVESLLICVSACSVGLVLSLLAGGVKQDFLSDTTWTVLAFEMKITPGILVAAFMLSVIVGVFGAITPALRASRMRIIDALRKA